MGGESRQTDEAAQKRLSQITGRGGRIKIDHVSVGGRDLHRLEEAFADACMRTDYGGPHSSGLTKMPLLGFRNGSYIELISPTRPDSRPDIWRKQIEEDGGPCAWAIEVDDIGAEVAAAKDAGPLRLALTITVGPAPTAWW